MLVSRLVFEKEGLYAEKFFETDHTAFYRFPDGEILTVTSYEKRASPLGVAGVPLKPDWIFVERDHLVFESFSIEEFETFDPEVKYLTNLPGWKKYEEKLREIQPEVFDEIFEKLKEGDFEGIVGFGPGLTPLGDDVLSGLLVAGCRLSFPMKTSEISIQQIKHAMKRLVPYPVKVFLETGDDSELLEMGATSGLGWAFGITYGLEGCR